MIKKLYILFVVLCFCSLSRLYCDESIGHIKVVIEGLKTDNGLVHIALYDSEDSYLDRGLPLNDAKLIVKNKKSEWTISDVPHGKYAVMLFHDENNNNKLDKNILGYPKEPFAFSNNIRPFLKQPGFDKVHFTFQNALKVINIKI